MVVIKECWNVKTTRGTGWEEGVVSGWSNGVHRIFCENCLRP
ncbi:hypothetical protein SUBVAR_07196 [Subdoligranulum variabile DSM 15176]|uniref:Uncharacterized protein n=1 Tax=Subdoligranulum variabile DSM 15176 TaxID=411471 RepID=D1PS13_9FIRM|nr:hypothetical protein SUBVAR_07196 [Subdoligranulum variabile DSM 15176]